MTTDAHLSVFEQLDLPDTSLTRDTYAHAAQATPAYIHDHCVRSYVFARAHAQNQLCAPVSTTTTNCCSSPASCTTWD
ncbi:hypothetical protein ABZU94_02535 [Streptomyces mirabilis]|uniref:hypothetical protein n=1 Tax=Streptomyces sp. NPDC005388 TaxID=3156717 RepID=UPI0033A7D1EE